MKIVKRKKGQFIVLAALIVAVMIVSIGTIMYGTVAYFRHERWQDYLMIIDNVELGSQRVFEISLANYTTTFNDTQILFDNLNQWQTSFTKAYPGFGVALTYFDAAIGNGTKNVTSQIDDTMYFSSANSALEINITSVGLTGYRFVASVFLGVILNATYDEGDLVIFIAVEKEDSTPVTNLNKENFFVNNESLAVMNSILVRSYTLDDDGVLRVVYRIVILNDPGLSDVLVAVVDTRGIKVVANSTVS